MSIDSANPEDRKSDPTFFDKCREQSKSEDTYKMENYAKAIKEELKRSEDKLRKSTLPIFEKLFEQVSKSQTRLEEKKNDSSSSSTNQENSSATNQESSSITNQESQSIEPEFLSSFCSSKRKFRRRSATVSNKISSRNEETKTISDDAYSDISKNNFMDPRIQPSLGRHKSQNYQIKFTTSDYYAFDLTLYPKNLFKDSNKIMKINCQDDADYCIKGNINLQVIDKFYIFTSLSSNLKLEKLQEKTNYLMTFLDRFQNYKRKELCFVHSKDNERYYPDLETLVKSLLKSQMSTSMLRFNPRMVKNKLTITRFNVTLDSLEQISTIFSHIRAIELIDCTMDQSLQEDIDSKRLNVNFEGRITRRNKVKQRKTIHGSQ